MVVFVFLGLVEVLVSALVLGQGTPVGICRLLCMLLVVVRLLVCCKRLGC